MNTKKMIIGLTAGMVLTFSASAWAGDRFDKKQNRQTDRIYEGVRSGKITPREYNRLIEEQWRIEKRRERALKDGHLTRHEKKQLNRMQSRAVKNIQRARHNAYQNKKKTYTQNRRPNPAPYCRRY
ncbi:MAG: hypothetical protein V2I97_18095 [Desulfococcaceae bacterium]|jgi:hypothetical protein|nr:hypothetical protein [Desulfococcaceae bacterium]